MLTRIIIALLLLGGATAHADDVKPAEQPRPFALTQQQANDYAAYLQNIMKQAEQQYNAAKAALDDLTKQAAAIAAPTAPQPEVKHK